LRPKTAEKNQPKNGPGGFEKRPEGIHIGRLPHWLETSSTKEKGPKPLNFVQKLTCASRFLTA
jgi:hypothetical protein